MKILMLSPSYPRNEEDSSGIFVRYLVEQLVADGTAVHVLAASDRDNSRSEKISENLTIERVRYCPGFLEVLFFRPSGGIPQRIKQCSPALLLAPFFFVAYCLAVFRRVRSCTIVHCHWLPTVVLAWLPAKCYGKKIVVSIRGSDMHDLQPAWLWHIILHGLLALADTVISVNKDYCTRALRILGEPQHSRRVTHIPNGVFLVDAPRPPCGSVRRLLFVGNVVPAKGLAELTHAFTGLRCTFPDVTLTLVGDLPADMDPATRQLLQMPGVTAHGSVPPQAIRALMLNHDLLVFPSHREGRPNVVIEAAASRLPIVATTLPGITEVFEDGLHALLVPPRSADDLQRAISALIAAPERAVQLAEAAFCRVHELGLSWQNCTRAHLNVYRSLASG